MIKIYTSNKNIHLHLQTELNEKNMHYTQHVTLHCIVILHCRYTNTVHVPCLLLQYHQVWHQWRVYRVALAASALKVVLFPHLGPLVLQRSHPPLYSLKHLTLLPVQL
jgi:hypothetical protein